MNSCSRIAAIPATARNPATFESGTDREDATVSGKERITLGSVQPGGGAPGTLQKNVHYRGQFQKSGSGLTGTEVLNSERIPPAGVNALANAASAKTP